MQKTKIWPFAKRLFRWSTIPVGLAVLVMTIAWLSGMFENKIPPGRVDETVMVHRGQPTDEVHEIEKAYLEEAIGTLKASSRTVIAAKLLATIEEVFVSAGDQVESGQVLLRLEDDEYRTRLDQAKQAYEAAVANREEAAKQFERIAKLIDRNAASQAEYDRASRNLQVAEAEQSRAQQAVSEAEVLLSYTVVKAPKQGRIVDRLAEPGDTARPGVPLLVLYDAASLRLEAPVMEQLAVRLQVGEELDVYVDALDRTMRATVDEIVPQADAPSRSFLVKASLPKSDDLYEGMFGRLRIPAGRRRHLCLNTDAIVRIGQLEFVDVVLPDDTVERRLIKTGTLGMPGRQEVLSGVEAGEQVILQQRITDTGETRDAG
jgi:RND family efflux transporter MFP subunit